MNLSDRFKASLEAFVSRMIARYDFSALYGCTVISQNGDGTLELKPDSAKLPGHSRVPIRYGIPGINATVTSGGRAMLGWDGGDPSKPYAIIHDAATLKNLTITASGTVVVHATEIDLGGTGQPVARQGDAVTVVCPVPGMSIVAGMPLAGVIAMGSAITKSA